MVPPERTASIACVRLFIPARPCFGLPPAHSKTMSAPLPPVRSLMHCYGILLRSIDHVIGPEFPRHGACFRANIDSNDASRAADTRDLHAFQSHAALPEDRDGITDPHACGFDGRNAVAERLKTCGFTVGDSDRQRVSAQFQAEQHIPRNSPVAEIR